MKTLKILLLSTIFLFSTAQALELKQLSLDQSIAIAKEQNKNLLIIFSIDNCIYCDMLKNEVIMFNIDNYVLCIVDVTNNQEISKAFKLRIFPTSVILSVQKNEEKIIDTYIGYNKDKYSQWIIKNDTKKSAQ
jgi:hypothetical protein